MAENFCTGNFSRGIEIKNYFWAIIRGEKQEEKLFLSNFSRENEKKSYFWAIFREKMRKIIFLINFSEG